MPRLSFKSHKQFFTVFIFGNYIDFAQARADIDKRDPLQQRSEIDITSRTVFGS